MYRVTIYIDLPVRMGISHLGFKFRTLLGRYQRIVGADTDQNSRADRAGHGFLQQAAQRSHDFLQLRIVDLQVGTFLGSVLI